MNSQGNGWRMFGAAFISLYTCTFKIKRKFWRLKFLLESAGFLSKVELGVGQRFDVPVRVGAGSGKLVIGDGVGFGWDAAPKLGSGTILLEPRTLDAEIQIGSGSMFSNNVSVIAMKKITIGKDCLIGDGVSIMDSDFHLIDPKMRRTGEVPVDPVL